MDEIKTLIEQYTPSTETVKLVNESRILLLNGVSGSGKDTTKRQLLRGSKYQTLVSYTTRAPRDNNGNKEIDDVDYHFISIETAREMILKRQFVEVKLVHGNIYGTGVKDMEEASKNNKIIVADIDNQGVSEYKQMSDKVVAIFILPPDYETWRQRFSNRYSDVARFEKDFARRLPDVVRALENALSKPYFHFILNDDFRNTARIIDQIMHQEVEFNYKDIEIRVLAENMLKDIKCRLEKTDGNLALSCFER